MHFTAADRDGYRVVCGRSNWEKHRRRHPELTGREAWVRRAIADPHFIYHSLNVPNRRMFHRLYRVGQNVETLRVIVEYNRQGPRTALEGVVVSAFMLQGARKGEVLLWSNSNPVPDQ